MSDRLRNIEHYVCPQCGCADMRHTAAIEKALYQAEERGVQEGLDLRDDLREQLAGAVDALRALLVAVEDYIDRPLADESTRRALVDAMSTARVAAGEDAAENDASPPTLKGRRARVWGL